jgi:hypothetical protein
MFKETQTTQTEKKQPVKRIRDGLISVSIWRQEGPTGAFFNVTLERSYQDDKEQWQYTNSLGRYDLLYAAKLLDRAHTWIVIEDARLKAEARQGNEQEEG